MSNEYTASVNRVVWSPDGALFGMFKDSISFHFDEIFLS